MDSRSIINIDHLLLIFTVVVMLLLPLPGNVSGSISKTASVYCESKKCQFKIGILDKSSATAYGSFKDTLLTTGWGILDITSGQATTPYKTNIDIMYGAGFLEGVLTAGSMESQYANLFSIFFHLPGDKDLLDKLSGWFAAQRKWADMMILENKNDPFWRHVNYICAQFDGLVDGYRAMQKDNATLDAFAVNVLNANGDLLDLIGVLRPNSLKDWTKFTPQEARDYFYSSGHCSALIKLLPGFENIYMSHSSWFDFRATNRIYKHYNLLVDDEATAAKRISFSSYGGYLESLDDFYILGSGMVMLQTTNNIFNHTLYSLVTNNSIMAWQRVRVANMMAHNGKEWANAIASFNSGTYNNQYMVIDLRMFKPLNPIPDNFLWVAEQIPGLVVAQDLTPVLRAGYFPSYNVPFFEEIFNKSGYQAFVEKHGTEYSYQLAPRAKIFRRDQGGVVDMDSFKAIMRYNDFKHDPYSKGSPMGAICSRGDLSPTGPKPDGCYDTKVTDLTMASKFMADIINGPTTSHDLPPFSWTGQFAKLSHVGLPQTYNFSFVRTQPLFQD